MADVEAQQQERTGCAKWCSCLTDANFKDASTILRLLNLINAALIIFAGIYTVIDISKLVTLKVATVAISVYLACFGCVLCCFEMRISMLEKAVRRRFGFMYTYVGRTLFLFFVATFLIARQTTTTYAIAAITLVNGLINCYVTVKHGEYYADPTGKYSTAEDATATYVQNNPELAQAAIGASVNYARQNPQLAQASLNAGATYAREHPSQAQTLASTAAQHGSNPFQVQNQ
mmetsp:Transcript_626/g.1574  ORF Transcript_626/g.1574 Transcript_626/m.1574 type:complete len:232 (-) Transcript_626:357-1052(-)|eukprot:CAMPEP_0171498476 /NCGR_PEP_ID=MMETSP0958-20121227/7877_1 /TAXON_ID=87120 /ORGANISM="Aurantiochytrium limacinum, Strain ATCCMYA-1381" /LENGTH=231 /DNA_ID=CAMNT_0012032891 /DNA_START=188 /DNA_END=883 /DNA_ORIENTATION=+